MRHTIVVKIPVFEREASDDMAIRNMREHKIQAMYEEVERLIMELKSPSERNCLCFTSRHEGDTE